MTEILTQDEISALLNAISHGDVEPPRPAQKVRTVDLRRRDFLTREQGSRLQDIHEDFAREAAILLQMQLRALVGIHVASLDILTFEEFARSVPNPSFLAVVDMSPLTGKVVLQIDPAIAFAIVEAKFGGTPRTKGINRTFTAIELAVLEDIAARMLKELPGAWKTVAEIEPRVESILMNPRVIADIIPEEMIALQSFEIKVGDIEGMMNICFPSSALEPVISRLDPAAGTPGIPVGTRGIIGESSFTKYFQYPFATMPMRLADIRALSSGAVIGLKGDPEGTVRFAYKGTAADTSAAINGEGLSDAAAARTDPRRPLSRRIVDRLRGTRGESVARRESRLRREIAERASSENGGRNVVNLTNVLREVNPKCASSFAAPDTERFSVGLTLRIDDGRALAGSVPPRPEKAPPLRGLAGREGEGFLLAGQFLETIVAHELVPGISFFVNLLY